MTLIHLFHFHSSSFFLHGLPASQLGTCTWSLTQPFKIMSSAYSQSWSAWFEADSPQIERGKGRHFFSARSQVNGSQIISASQRLSAKKEEDFVLIFWYLRQSFFRFGCQVTLFLSNRDLYPILTISRTPSRISTERMASKSVVNEPESMQRFTDIAGEPRRMLAPIMGYEKMPLVSLKEAG